MNDLKQIAKEIRSVIRSYSESHHLTFKEEAHEYNMDGMPKDALSVSGILELFSHPFIAENTGSFKKLNGNKELEDLLLEEWKLNGKIAAETGSRTHWGLEKYVVDRYKLGSEVRKPIFDCDKEQTNISNAKIKAGIKFVKKMEDRGCVAMDTETVMAGFGYFGQCDNFFLHKNRETGKLCIISTDWKTSKAEGFSKQWYHKQMKEPFTDLVDNNLSHYSIQIPLYSRLLKFMLKDSKFEDVGFCGGIIVRLDESGEYEEYRIDNKLFNKVMNMNIKEYL